MKIRNLVIAVVTASAVLPGVPATAAERLHECAKATTRCDGEISVPLDWSDPSSERITVAFAWLPRKDAIGTILANPGGPAPALPDMPIVEEALGPVLDRQNLLVVEPRGLGKSTPLLCPGLDLNVPKTIGECAAQLGPRVRYFTADQAVADMNAVRQALGVSKVTFYGNSYGTLFAQAYATRHAGSTAAVFLDSTMVTTPEGYATWPLRTRLDSLDLVCASSRACRALPGTPGGTWTRLVARLRAHPDQKVPLTALAAVGASLFQPVFGREANAAASAYLQGDRAPLHRLARAVGASPAPPLEGAQWAGYLAYRCGDGASPFDRDASPAERSRQLKRYYLEERPLKPFTVTELGGKTPLEFCVNWPTPRHSPPVPSNAEYPPVPVLAVGGDFDTNSPAEVAEGVRRFPDSTFVRVHFGGHSLAWGDRPVNRCVRSVMRSFLAAPSHPVPPMRCSAENYRAAGAFPQSVEEVTPIRASGLSGEERRLVGAAFATVEDASTRRNPYSSVHSLLKTEPGLRGGRLDFDDKVGTISLEKVRFVDDLTVSGRIRLEGSGKATAQLLVTGADRGPHKIRLSWSAFLAQERPPVSGTFDGRVFSS
ncbi:alpha/beta hydrolase [Streptosporangium sp. NBC_01756]|uniref:alpha/beta hydrolase n=1 Tax=Streptosporangium sp. NBC_01756 TaxID=2975950 RepID=UPI002DDA8C68|nr:alpha/beta hydrolase [Streptosporangium sp. NBC_01756]WSC87477.1 alpha/beta hydrolase [Streptosporangium sp. NBC_01756]